jgi:actin-related protein
MSFPLWILLMHGQVGGTSMMPGFVQRLQREVSALAPQGAVVCVVAPPMRKYAAWIGAAYKARLSSFQSLLVSREEYDENGSNIMRRRAIGLW